MEHPDDPVAVTRTVTLDASADAVWRSLVDEAELSAWFGADVHIDPVAGGLARFDDGVNVRRAVVHAVETGRRLGFTWWDEADPADARTVEFRVDPSDDPASGPVRLTVTETVATGGAGGGPRACSASDLVDGWSDRLGRLPGLVGRRSPLTAGAAQLCPI